jgi:membrane protease YdiL (CAAX protease family)
MPLNDNSVVTEESQKAETKPYPGFLQAVWLLVLYGIVAFLLMIPVGIMAGISDMPLHKDPLFRVIVLLGALTFVLWYGIEKSKTRFRQLFSFKATRTSLLLPFIITLIGLQIISAEVNGIVVSVIPGAEAAAQSIMDFAQKETYVFIVFAIVLAPVVEELMFRGLILRGFLQRYSIKKAIIVSALFFALYHGNAFQFLPAFFAGVLFAWWFLKTRSLMPCLFGHVFNNAFILFTASWAAAYVPESETSQHWPIWLNVLGIFLLISGIWLSVLLFKKHPVDKEIPVSDSPDIQK